MFVNPRRCQSIVDYTNAIYIFLISIQMFYDLSFNFVFHNFSNAGVGSKTYMIFKQYQL